MLRFITNSFLVTKKTPQFWHKPCLTAQFLLPLSVIYFFVKRLNFSKTRSKKFDLKVICIGNAIAGGAGKTPAAIAVRQNILAANPSAKITFISTGYKGRLRGPVQVDIAKHDFYDVGDEALLLASHGTAIIARERAKALELAASLGYEYAILDDGLHDKTIVKDITFLVIDGNYGFGNGLLIPAGPLRDRVDYAIEGTDRIILIGEDKKNLIPAVKRFGRKDFPVHKTFIDPVTALDTNQVYVAFAGIGRPQKFFDMLKDDLKLVIAETVDFADHHNYTSADFEHLEALAEQQKAKLITTEKDYIKLPADFAANVECMKIELKFEDNDLQQILANI